MQRAWKAEEYKKFFQIMKSTSIRPEKIGGEPFENALKDLSAGKLKQLLLQSNVDITGCLEKSDLIEKLKSLLRAEEGCPDPDQSQSQSHPPSPTQPPAFQPPGFKIEACEMRRELVQFLP